MHPASIRRTPFDRYRTQAPPAPTENPYRFIHKKLGLSEAAFEARLKEDVEALLKEIEDDKLTQEVHTPPSTPQGHVLSKDECFKMLCMKELTTGSLLGNYLWAADLHRSRFNFDITWDAEGLSVLDAYDF